MNDPRLLFKSSAILLLGAAGMVHAQTPWVDNAGNWHDAPTSYTFACRGPLDVEVSMTASPPITMHFVKASKPATSGVDSGACAWIDRGVAASEPNCLQHYANDISITVSSHAPAAAAVSPGVGRSRIGAGAVLRENTAAMSLEQIAQEQTTPTATSTPTVTLNSYTRAPYIRFIATSSDPIAYFRAFAIPGRACLFVERVGP